MTTLLPTDQDWLALCLCTESSRPREWPFVAQVIENRRATGRWGTTYRDVILARSQFSAFNDRPHGLPDNGVFAVQAGRQVPLLLMRAAAYVGPGTKLETAHGNLVRDWAEEISATTLHYWSPASMVPKGSRPAWASSAKRLYTPDGVDPERFVFAEGVP